MNEEINQIQSNSHASLAELSRKNLSDPSAGLIGTMITIDFIDHGESSRRGVSIGRSEADRARPTLWAEMEKTLHTNIMKYMNYMKEITS